MKKKATVTLNSSQTDDLFSSQTTPFKSRSSSNRSFLKQKPVGKTRRGPNLSLVRTPSVGLKKTQNYEKKIDRQCFSLNSIYSRLNIRLQTAKKENIENYFNECKFVLQELISLNQPISELLKEIQEGFDLEFLKNNESKNYETNKYKEKNDSKLRSSPDALSFFDRLKSRKTLKKKLNFSKKTENSGFSSSRGKSVPRLNITKITVAKQDSSEKMTNTREDTLKQFFIQDYQDEFMSKFDEFSESWRRLIREKNKKMN